MTLNSILQTLTVPIEFSAPIWYWKGPAPHYFVTVPEKEYDDIKAMERSVSYGWGMIPVRVRIGKSEWKTAMFPKDGSYILPLKASVRKAEKLDEGDTANVWLEVGQFG